MKSFIETLAEPSEIKSLSLEQLKALCQEIRERIIEVMSVNGGHLGSNLGIVELTVAMHKVFDSPTDKFIFDTSHQAYPHKLLTGRNKQFPTIRKYKGLSGFSSPSESKHDHFYAGHAGTALSLSLGVAKSRDLNQENSYVLPVIGDAALTCGLTYEALNNIPKQMKNFILILNDNNMAISKNVGAITGILSRIVNNPSSNKLYEEVESLLSKIPGVGKQLSSGGNKLKESLKSLVSTAPFFEQYGLSYTGPIDGHDLKHLISTLEAAKNSQTPCVIHCLTTKGQGMETAISSPTTYHGVKPFNTETGKFHPSKSKKPTFPKVFGKHLLEMADKDEDIVALTPAMPAGSCLTDFMDKYPDRCLDVGIAEGHCVTFAGGLAYKSHKKVVCCVYATFLQRALDNLYHDVCLQQLPVVFALDREGIAGGNGVTHNGIYDISFLNAMPNMVIAQPRNGQLLKELLESSFSYNSPVAIRYPNLPTEDLNLPIQKRVKGKAEVLVKGEKLAILALGNKCQTALEVKDLLSSKNINPTVIDPVFIKPLDQELLYRIFMTHPYIVTIEEHAVNAGFGQIICQFAMKNGFSTNQVLNFGIPEVYLEQGSHKELTKEVQLDAISIEQKIYEHFFVKPETYATL